MLTVTGTAPCQKNEELVVQQAEGRLSQVNLSPLYIQRSFSALDGKGSYT